ncbi:unnamed protein product [Closterium sp. Naga37s-1]|nr:unnamed protein product [Closterium sp. Naga37s-1]
MRGRGRGPAGGRGGYPPEGEGRGQGGRFGARGRGGGGGGRGGGGRGPPAYEPHPPVSQPAYYEPPAAPYAPPAPFAAGPPAPAAPRPAAAPSVPPPAPAPLPPPAAPSAEAVVAQLTGLALSRPSGVTSPFPRRPDRGGTVGQIMKIRVNHFPLQIADLVIYHYDVVISPDIAIKRINREVIRELSRVYHSSHLGNRLLAFDGVKNVYTAAALPFEAQEFQVSLPDDRPAPAAGEAQSRRPRDRSFKVVLRLAASASVSQLMEFLAGRQTEVPQEVLQAIDIVLREQPTRMYVPVARSFFSPDLGPRAPIGNGVEAWKGFYQSVRPTQMGLTLNLDMAATAFLEPLMLPDFVMRLLNRHSLQQPLSDFERFALRKGLRGVRIEVTHRGQMRRKYKLTGLTTQPLQALTYAPPLTAPPLLALPHSTVPSLTIFLAHPRPCLLPMCACSPPHGLGAPVRPWCRFPLTTPEGEAQVVTVEAYFRQHYNLQLQLRNMPCATTGQGDRVNYLPLEVRPPPRPHAPCSTCSPRLLSSNAPSPPAIAPSLSPCAVRLAASCLPRSMLRQPCTMRACAYYLHVGARIWLWHPLVCLLLHDYHFRFPALFCPSLHLAPLLLASVHAACWHGRRCGNAYERDPFAAEFGIRVAPQMATINARVLPTPTVPCHCLIPPCSCSAKPPSRTCAPTQHASLHMYCSAPSSCLAVLPSPPAWPSADGSGGEALGSGEPESSAAPGSRAVWTGSCAHVQCHRPRACSTCRLLSPSPTHFHLLSRNPLPIYFLDFLSLSHFPFFVHSFPRHMRLSTTSISRFLPSRLSLPLHMGMCMREQQMEQRMCVPMAAGHAGQMDAILRNLAKQLTPAQRPMPDVDIVVWILNEGNGPLYGTRSSTPPTHSLLPPPHSPSYHCPPPSDPVTQPSTICGNDPCSPPPILLLSSNCCLATKLGKGKQYLANVALKINAKVGGRNTALVDSIQRQIPLICHEYTILFGADVTHPSPGEDNSPSIAAVVASMDWPEMARYRALVSAQAHRVEIIQNLYTCSQDANGTLQHGGMVRELLISFYRSTGHKPQRVVMYRDGVSDGQFAAVKEFEVAAIKQACASLEESYNPLVTFAVVQKRHHTRFFPFDSRNRSTTDRSGNALPGTVIDTGICHPTEFDFYLLSHSGIQGTSRPTHYHVVHDENGFDSNTLQRMTYSMAYTYARCTRAVSVVPPAYYAHIVAFRARFYMDPDQFSDTGSQSTAFEHAPAAPAPSTVTGTSATTGESSGSRSSRSAGEVVVRPLPPLQGRVREHMFFC